MMKTTVNYRQDFPIFAKPLGAHPLIYFDTAATAQKPLVVIDAISDFYKQAYGTVHRGIYTLSKGASDLFNQARIQVQTFINAAAPEEIIFTRGATASLNLLARSFGKHFIRPGQAIIISEIEHHANIVPWQMVCEEYGALLRIIPVDDAGELILEAFDALLDEKVRLVTLAHMSNVFGTIHPVKTIIEKAHRVGAYVCLDGAQAIAHFPVDVQELDVDFYAFSGHKLYGPTGIGVLYGKQHLLEKLPPIEGGGDMIEKVTLQKTTYNELPFKFEAGTPMIAEAIGLKAAIQYLEKIGMESIYHWEQELLHYAEQKLLAIPNLQILGQANHKGAIITFTIEGIHPFDLGTLLDCKGIALRTGHHCSQPSMERFGLTASSRISFGLYNTLEEIDLFLNALTSIVNLLS